MVVDARPRDAHRGAQRSYTLKISVAVSVVGGLSLYRLFTPGTGTVISADDHRKFRGSTPVSNRRRHTSCNTVTVRVELQTMQQTLFFLLGICCCSYALPPVITQIDKRLLRPSNGQVRNNITNAGAEFGFDSPHRSPLKRPNVCDDCVCGVGRKIRIVGGDVTSVYEYPWMVSMSNHGTFYCAGSLITRRHVLTAAHCMEGFNTKSIKLVLADSDRPKLDKNAIVRRVKSVSIHENFHSYTFNNDIAIIEMDRPVDVNGIVRTACLPEDKAIDYTGATATVVGWGRTGEDQAVSNELRKVSLPILSQEECDQAGYQKKRITENMFCAGYLEGERDACFGDSGGPLHVKGTYGHLEVVGIISWGRGCAKPKFPGIYTRVTNYLGWMTDHLDGECVCPPPRH